MTDTDRLEYLMAAVGIDRPTIDARIAARTEPETRELPGYSTRIAFGAMEAEQREEYADYVHRCGGTPISKVKP